MATKEHFEKAAEGMQQLMDEDFVNQLQDANEAKTRLLVIDRVLNIVGWPKEDYNPEKKTSTGGYTDYLLTIDGIPRLIVEAKRMGIIKPMEPNLQRRQYRNSFLSKNCGTEISSLLEQCRGYCIDCGIPYALATTGTVWIVLVGFRYGVEWGKLKSFVFHSLKDISANFHEFYSLVSREAIKNNALEEKFSSIVLVKPSVAIRPREHVTYNLENSPIENRQIIRAFFDQFMGDITGQKEMLEHCYVSNQRLSEFSRELRQLLDYDAILDEQEFQIDRIDEQKLEQAVEIQLASKKPKTILVVGNIGAGKSTFIHQFALGESDKHHACVVINLIDEVRVQVENGREEEQHIARRILEEIARRFSKKIDPYDPDTLRGCFEVELGRFNRQKTKLRATQPEEYEVQEESYLQGLTNHPYNHLVGYIKYVRKRGYKPWIAFDNVDRGSASYQEFAYGFAQKLANEAGCVTLITLREDTFLEAQESGFLDVRSSDVIFMVNAPELRQIVSKRRKYVDWLIEQNKLPKLFSEYKHLIFMLNWHIKRLILDDDESIRKLVTTFSLNNVRFALTMLRDYYLSYHSTFHGFYEKYQNCDETFKNVAIDYEQEHNRFIQALMLSNGWAYKEQNSEIFNLFSADRQERTSHFLILRILAYLNLDKNVSSTRNLLNCEKVINDFVFLGYQRHHINTALRRLFQFDLVVSPHLLAFATERKVDIPDPLPPDIKIRLSAKGYYYLTELVRKHYYQMRVAEDTIWYNEELVQLYITCLKESVENQTSFGKDDVLVATDAREFFMQYLRRCLVEENQMGGIRITSLEWARIMNDVVERNIFGEQITESLYVKDDSGLSEKSSISRPYTSSRQITSIVGKKSSLNSKNSEQMTLFGTKPDYEKAIKEAIKSLGKMPQNKKLQDSKYVIRILWVLEVADRAGIGPLRASDIATLICDYGNEPVAPTNVARFFRSQKKMGEYTHFWKEEPEKWYTISLIGRDTLLSVIKKSK
jgi:predicted type IV restriction endonuclease